MVEGRWVTRMEIVQAPDPAAMVAAQRYAVLQPLIVDKTPLFEWMIQQVTSSHPAGPARIIELGVGTGGFLEEVVRQRLWLETTLIGCDCGVAPLAVARERLAAHGRSAVLCGGVNALDPQDAFYTHLAAPASADVVVLSQFEHYAPNQPESRLARRLSEEGRFACSKAALRRLAASLLRPGGWLFVVDDYAADTPEEQAAWEAAWDAQVVRDLGEPRVHRKLAAFDPAGAATLARRYSVDRPLAQRLALVARARSRRRHRDFEEIQSLTEAQADFRELFGAGRAGVVAHPASSSYPQFFLLWGRL
ncbi:MAG: class I SAM-dependent methyltransferase [Verrucomicrobiales bacterium]